MNFKDDSLLSSLSNVSDCGIKYNLFGNDFFNKSGESRYREMKNLNNEE